MLFIKRLALCAWILAAGLFFAGCAEKDPTVLTPQVAAVRIEARTNPAAPLTGGRGFLVSADGLIVTCLHVVEAAQDITVINNDGERLFADFVQGDRDADLAVIRVHAGRLPYLKLHEGDLEPGMHVRVLGTSGAKQGVFEQWENFGKELDLDIPLLPTDSGSPVMADDGRVIAVARTRIKDRPSDSSAIPIWRLLKMMPAIESRSWLSPRQGE